MASLSSLLKRIKSGEVDGMQDDVKALLSTCSSTTESQQLIRHCSRHVYEQPKILQTTFSCVVDVVMICCNHQHGQTVADLSFHIKSMYYIILMASKRKDLQEYLYVLLEDLSHYINSVDATSGDTQVVVKNLYQSIWNTSLTVESSRQALTLQQYSLMFLLASGASVSKVCDQAMRILLNYEHVNKSLENARNFCLAIINKITETLKRWSSVDGDTVLAIIHLVLQYAKSLTISGKCSDFSKTTRPLVGILEGLSDQKTTVALKVGLKLTEVGMALKVGKCQEDMMVKFLQSSGMVPDAHVPNSIMVLSLLCTLALFETQDRKDFGYSISSNLLESIVDNILARCNTRLTEENVKKVAAVLCQQLGRYVEMMKSARKEEDVLKQALPWALKTNSFIKLHCNEKSETVWQIYNVGVNTGNLGVLAFKGKGYDEAAKFLETSVEMLSIYCGCTSITEDQKKSVKASLHKKIVLWSDSLRYNGNHWDAAVAACWGMLMGQVALEELLTIWVKCKRDAEKTENTRLRGLTICDVVRDARAKYRTSHEVLFDPIKAIQCEISNYKKQSHDTTEDQLSCGRAIIDDAKCAESKIYGLLIVSESLWVQPGLAAQKDEALQAVKDALTLIVETKSKDQSSTKLRELEAVSYFWLYLCHLQQIQDVATAEVQEAGKPVSLSVQAADLGEEVQVDDFCDVRATPTCLTLHAQETSLAPLNVALSIWENLNTKGITLEEPSLCLASLASAGYIYQLSGLVNPTVRSWTVLVSLARRHSNKIYFVKGVSELLLMVPELISCELIKDTEALVASLQGEECQDSSSSYLCLSYTAAVAYYYLKTGQYEKGSEKMKEALENEIMAKRTIKATEIQALVHYIDSLYAWMPPWVTKSDQNSSQSCISRAMLACRQAMAVLKSSVPTSNEILCWRHRVGWLHLTTTMWLGHLCWSSGQPRLARAFLKQSLTLTQELALPLRTGQLLALLARVDLLCDQLDDCRVKVDSLLGLLVVHPSNPVSYTPMTTKNLEPVVCVTPVKSKEKLEVPSFQIFNANENSEGESIRACNGTQEYDLKSVNFNSGLLVIGHPERISQLAAPQPPPSPSLRYREESAIVPIESCHQGESNCVTCSTPVVHHLRMSAAVLLASIHVHKDNFRVARKNLEKFREIRDRLLRKTSDICNGMMSFMNNKWKNKNKSSTKFIQGRINLVYLESLHCQAELLALEDNLEQAISANQESLKIVNSLDKELLLQDFQFVTIMIQQQNAMQRAFDQRKQEILSIERGREEEQEGLTETNKSEEDEVKVIAFKTPARRPTRYKRATGARTSLRASSRSVATMKGKNSMFSDYDDDSDDVDEAENDVNSDFSCTKVKGRTHAKSSRKQNLDLTDVEKQFSQLDLDKSPIRGILKVPNAPSKPSSSMKSTRVCYGGVENKNVDDCEDSVVQKDPRCRSKLNTCTDKKKQRGKFLGLDAPSLLIFSDKDSPESAETHTDALEDIPKKEETKPRRGRPKKISEDKSSISKTPAVSSKTKTQTDTTSRGKSRSSRTLR